MKRIIVLNVVLAIIVLCFTSCNEPYEPLGNAVTVIKLKKTEYKDYIIAFAPDDNHRIFAGLGNYNIMNDSVVSPYRELPDNYLLIDWRWYLFPQEPYCLVFEPWHKYPNGGYYCRNSDSVKYILHPLHRRYTVDMGKVNSYLGVEELYRKDYEEARKGHYEFAVEVFNPLYMDSIWVYTQKQLSVIINNGDLDKVLYSKSLR